MPDGGARRCALVAGTRFWFIDATRAPIPAWFITGLLVTIALEFYATRVNGRWNYGPLMPVVPVLRIGVAPLLQWLAIPAMLFFLMDRHFCGKHSIERKSG